MKDRTIPCAHYVCANADCKKGRKNVTMKTCKNCEKYCPRKVGKRMEPVATRRRKDKERHEDYKI